MIALAETLAEALDRAPEGMIDALILMFPRWKKCQDNFSFWAHHLFGAGCIYFN
jgi:hypothetical protein